MTDTDDRLDRYLDHRLPEVERERFEAALSDDDELRARLIARHRARQAEAGQQVPPEVRAQVEGLVRPAPARGRWPVGRAFATALAATLLAVLGFWWVRPDVPLGDGAGEVLRQGPAVGAVGIELIAPAADADHRGPAITFRWRPVAEVVSYTVVVVDLEGEVQLRRETADDALVVRATGGVRSGSEVMFWYVEARLVSGEVVASSLRRLRWRADPGG